MTIPIESILSSLSILLTAIASLRAVSRLESRFANDGAIGLMDGPPILGPFDSPRMIGNNGTIKDALRNISPLWEHSEGFRRAVVLGLLTSGSNSVKGNEILSSVFTDMDRQTDVDDESAIDAAVDAGLIVPTRGGSIKSKRRQQEKREEEAPKNNPLVELTTWFLRELSAPLSAIPAWHGMFCSFLREQRKRRQSKRTISNIWRRWRGTYLDTSNCDFDAVVSGVARIPCVGIDRISRNTTIASKNVRVKAYAPKTFRDLRTRCFRVTEREYARSILNMNNGAAASTISFGNGYDANGHNFLDEGLTDERAIHDKRPIPQVLKHIVGRNSNKMQILPYISFQSNSKGAARAGTFFFFTADGAFMIKTVKKEEAKAFLDMLPEYHRFMSDRRNGRNSLLTRIFGMYSVQILEDDNHSNWNGGLYSCNKHENKQSDYTERVFLVMNSVFPAKASSFVTERFDLKGSTVGRECSIEEQKIKGANAVLKDLNLKREVDGERNKQHYACGIHVGKKKKNALMTQLKKDVDLLERCSVLDYSLLVGVAEMDLIETFTNKKQCIPNTIHRVLHWMDSPLPYHGASMPKIDGGHLSCLLGTRRGKHVIYYLGIIDFLQPWTMKKMIERDLKGLAGYDIKGISCVAPSDYAARFLSFMDRHLT
eukprot:scaffold1955_cov68-Cyclotella_meneghiniana.AAC.4